ncbi:unnamed protein product [Lampetra fluviatilis]
MQREPPPTPALSGRREGFALRGSHPGVLEADGSAQVMVSKAGDQMLNLKGALRGKAFLERTMNGVGTDTYQQYIKLNKQKCSV